MFLGARRLVNNELHKDSELFDITYVSLQLRSGLAGSEKAV